MTSSKKKGTLDGATLKKKHDELIGQHGAWTRYLRQHGIATTTAENRMQAAAEGRTIRPMAKRSPIPAAARAEKRATANRLGGQHAAAHLREVQHQ